LRPFGIKPTHQKAGNGHLRKDFQDAWKRYLPGETSQAAGAIGDRRPSPTAEKTVADAEAFKTYLLESDLSATTTSRRLQFARQFFRVALRRKLIEENPFAEVRHHAGN